jgi:hypothetical protein
VVRLPLWIITGGHIMRTALVKLTGHPSNSWSLITFFYKAPFPSPENTWTCFPNYIGADKGTWYARGGAITLQDDAGNYVLMLDMENAPASGYPFTGRAGTKSKDAVCYKKGALFYHQPLEYEVLSG